MRAARVKRLTSGAQAAAGNRLSAGSERGRVGAGRGLESDAGERRPASGWEQAERREEPAGPRCCANAGEKGPSGKGKEWERAGPPG